MQKTTEKDSIKAKQIQSLYSSFPKIQELEKQTRFLFPLKINRGSEIVDLIIYLPSLFPDESPIFYLSVYLPHPWVVSSQKNSLYNYQILGHPALSGNYAWASLSFTLARLIKLVEKEFFHVQYYLNNSNYKTNFSPVETSSSSSSSSSLDLQTTSSGSTNSSEGTGGKSPDLTSSRHSEPNSDHALSESDFPQFTASNYASLGEKQLSELLNDEDKFSDFFQNLDYIKKLKAMKSDLFDECREIAKRTLLIENEVQSIKDNIKSQNETVSNLMQDYEKAFSKQKLLSKDYNYNSIINKLKASVFEAETKAENIIQDFSQEKLQLDHFLESYFNARNSSYFKSFLLNKFKTDPAFLTIKNNMAD